MQAIIPSSRNIVALRCTPEVAQKLVQALATPATTQPVTDRRKRRAAKATGVAPIGPMQLLLPAICATSQMSAYQRWADKPYTDTPKSGWERMALDAARQAFAMGSKRADFRTVLTPLTAEVWPTPTVVVRARKPVAMSIRDEGI